jgi:hypothetical protein
LPLSAKGQWARAHGVDSRRLKLRVGVRVRVQG